LTAAGPKRLDFAAKESNKGKGLAAKPALSLYSGKFTTIIAQSVEGTRVNQDVCGVTGQVRAKRRRRLPQMVDRW
jgi:hypothetical protein